MMTLRDARAARTVYIDFYIARAFAHHRAHGNGSASIGGGSSSAAAAAAEPATSAAGQATRKCRQPRAPTESTHSVSLRIRRPFSGRCLLLGPRVWVVLEQVCRQVLHRVVRPARGTRARVIQETNHDVSTTSHEGAYDPRQMDAAARTAGQGQTGSSGSEPLFHQALHSAHEYGHDCVLQVLSRGQRFRRRRLRRDLGDLLRLLRGSLEREARLGRRRRRPRRGGLGRRWCLSRLVSSLLCSCCLRRGGRRAVRHGSCGREASAVRPCATRALSAGHGQHTGELAGAGLRAARVQWPRLLGGPCPPPGPPRGRGRKGPAYDRKVWQALEYILSRLRGAGKRAGRAPRPSFASNGGGGGIQARNRARSLKYGFRGLKSGEQGVCCTTS